MVESVHLNTSAQLERQRKSSVILLAKNTFFLSADNWIIALFYRGICTLSDSWPRI